MDHTGNILELVAAMFCLFGLIVGMLLLFLLTDFLKDVFFPRYDKIKIQEWKYDFHIVTDSNWKRYYCKGWAGDVKWSSDLTNAKSFSTLEDAQQAACEWLASKPSKKYPIYHSVTCEERETTQTNN